MPKKILWGVLFAVLFGGVVPTVAAAAEIPRPTSEFYVYDGADVIDSEVEDLILTVNRNYEQTVEQPQIAVVTVESLDGLSVEEYAVELFEEWEIGQEDSDNGVLVLLSEGDRQVRIEVGYGLEGAINDSKAGRTIDHQLDALGQDDFSTALEGIFTDLSVEVNQEYEYDNEMMLGFVPDRQESSPEIDADGLAFLARIVVTLSISILGVTFIFAIVYWGYIEFSWVSSERAKKQRDIKSIKAKYPNRTFTKQEMAEELTQLQAERKAVQARKAEIDRASAVEKAVKDEIYQRNQSSRRRREPQARRHTTIHTPTPTYRPRNNDDDHFTPFGGGGFGGGSFGGGGSSGGGGASSGF